MNLEEVVQSCNGNIIFGDASIECKNFSKDTRTINSGDIYVGIKGENFDGNILYKEAFEKGAKMCILQGISEEEILDYKKEIESNNPDFFNGKAIVLVEDTIKALQQIASYKRSLYNIPVIAVTGSVGKTSTKDIVASVVGMKYKVHKTQGNLNNHIGVPLTILQLDNHEAIIVEMGMNNLGEISVLTRIARPNIAIITNVGTAHIGILGSRENIRKAKLEILEGLEPGGTLVINNDNDMLHDWYENIYKSAAQNTNKDLNVATYGIENDSLIMAKNIDYMPDSSTFDIDYNGEISKVFVPVGGEHFVYNALCGITVGRLLNMDINAIAEGIKNFELTKSRMELIKVSNGATLINDCYNANYDSMKAGIEYLAKTAKARKIAVLGDMLELGEYAKELHTKVGEEVNNNNIDLLITVGELGKVIAKEATKKCPEVKSFDNNDDAISYLLSIIKQDDTILVKASNGMKFKEIVEAVSKM